MGLNHRVTAAQPLPRLKSVLRCWAVQRAEALLACVQHAGDASDRRSGPLLIRARIDRQAPHAVAAAGQIVTAALRDVRAARSVHDNRAQADRARRRSGNAGHLHQGLGEESADVHQAANAGGLVDDFMCGIRLHDLFRCAAQIGTRLPLMGGNFHSC